MFGGRLRKSLSKDFVPRFSSKQKMKSKLSDIQGQGDQRNCCPKKKGFGITQVFCLGRADQDVNQKDVVNF